MLKPKPIAVMPFSLGIANSSIERENEIEENGEEAKRKDAKIFSKIFNFDINSCV